MVARRASSNPGGDRPAHLSSRLMRLEAVDVMGRARVERGRLAPFPARRGQARQPDDLAIDTSRRPIFETNDSAGRETACSAPTRSCIARSLR
ncbi:hypothetical protein BGLA2_70020 [Burkholderia gladioli]|nr:hypothetical protein BGLA2_70020 [Burkholderia gladioli]